MVSVFSEIDFLVKKKKENMEGREEGCHSWQILHFSHFYKTCNFHLLKNLQILILLQY